MGGGSYKDQETLQLKATLLKNCPAKSGTRVAGTLRAVHEGAAPSTPEAGTRAGARGRSLEVLLPPGQRSCVAYAVARFVFGGSEPPHVASLSLALAIREEAMTNDQTTSPLWPADDPAVTAHINLLQGIINRLANNSASCKTWCLTLVAALVSLAGATDVPGIVTFALVPVVIFGFLDAMYLAQERAYRELYSRIVNTVRDGSYTRANVYEAKAPLGFGRIFSTLASWSIYPVYLGLIAMYLVAHFAGWLTALTAGA